MKTLLMLIKLFISLMVKPKEIQVEKVLEIDDIKPVEQPVITPVVKPKPDYTGWIKNATRVNFPESNYVVEKTTKVQVVTHHTVGGSAHSSINTWLQDPQRVCTHFIIDRDGSAYQLFSLDHWGYHLYVAEPANKIPLEYKKKGSDYDKHSIGIELCNFGPINVRNNRYYNIYNQPIDSDKVIKQDFKGYQYWEKYDPRQIAKLESILLELIEIYPHIKDSLLTDYSSIFDINMDALNQKPGIFSHVSYRRTKSDCVKQPILIDMLNNLKSKA